MGRADVQGGLAGHVDAPRAKQAPLPVQKPHRRQQQRTARSDLQTKTRQEQPDRSKLASTPLPLTVTIQVCVGHGLGGRVPIKRVRTTEIKAYGKVREL